MINPKGFVKGLVSKMPVATNALKTVAQAEAKPLAQAIKEKSIQSFPPRQGGASSAGKWQMDLFKESRK
jgi:hypothetical protein